MREVTPEVALSVSRMSKDWFLRLEIGGNYAMTLIVGYFILLPRLTMPPFYPHGVIITRIFLPITSVIMPFLPALDK